jgi:phosphohistidine phosphatase
VGKDGARAGRAVKRLLLLRHASAASGRPDAARPLDGRGRVEAERIGRRIATLGPAPEAALSSPARRARETLEAVLPALDPTPVPRLEDALYLASPRSILAVVGALAPTLASVLVVAHNPGLEDLARELAQGAVAADAALHRALRGGLPPATLVALELDTDDWEALECAPARLVALLGP